jgi:steroid 5-alpha reductase family enzyme
VHRLWCGVSHSVGEQLHWWGLALLAAHQGHSWMMLGAFLNSVCLGVATRMVEARMLRNAARLEVYKQYQQQVDCWIPFSQPIAAIQAMLPGAAGGNDAPAAANRPHRE